MIGEQEWWVNDTDMGALGLVLADAPGWHGLTRRLTDTSLALRAGALIAGSTAVRTPARELTIQATLMPQGTVPATRERWRDLLAILYAGLVEVTIGDEPRLMVRALCVEHDLAPTSPDREMVVHARGGKVTLKFLVPDPYKYDREPVIVSLAEDVVTPLPMGTAPAGDARLTIMGPGVGPAFTLTDGAGVVRGMIGWESLTLPTADDWLDFDLSTLAMTTMIGGVAANATSHYTTGFPPVLDPAASAGALRATVANGLGLLTYRRGWLP